MNIRAYTVPHGLGHAAVIWSAGSAPEIVSVEPTPERAAAVAAVEAAARERTAIKEGAAMIRYNRLHGLSDVRSPDGALLGAVPDTRQGRAGGEDAITAYLCLDVDTPQTVVARLACARRVIVLAGGVPATSAVLRAGGGSWEVAVLQYRQAAARAEAAQ